MTGPPKARQATTPMKQSAFDRELRLLAKAEAKKNGWKSVAGIPYWTVGPLFFDLTLAAGAKEGSFSSSLRFKWLDLDRVLWKVLGLSSNEKEPFSLHANGAFVLMGQEILSIQTSGLESGGFRCFCSGIPREGSRCGRKYCSPPC